MLGPIMSAPGGGDARRPLALAFRRHRTGDSFYEVTDPQGHGKRLIIKKPASRRRLKTERKDDETQNTVCWETRFDQPIRRITRTRGQRSPGIRVSLRALAMAGRPKPIKPELTCGIFPEYPSPQPAFPAESIRPAKQNAPDPEHHECSSSPSTSCDGIRRSWG